jgi:hypothetical protein
MLEMFKRRRSGPTDAEDDGAGPPA